MNELKSAFFRCIMNMKTKKEGIIMRNRNVFGHLEYVWNNFYLSVLLFVLYRNILFCPVFGLSYTASMVILALSVTLNMVLGVFLTLRRRRNCTSLLCNLALSYGVYFIVSFWSGLRSKFLVAGAVALIAAALYCLLVLANFIQDRHTSAGKATRWQWISSCLLSCRTLVSVVLAFLLITTAIKPLFGLPLVDSNGNTVLSSTTDVSKKTIEKNMDTLLLLQQEQWSKLDTPARLAVMQTVGDIEANYLGIQALPIHAELLGENTLGQYNASERTVALNIDHLTNANAETMLLTVCHELYHAYQHRLVDLYSAMDEETKALLLFRDAACYKDEFENYIHGEDDFENYAAQWCEIDSDDYARSAAGRYYSSIHDYLEEAVG